MSPNGRYKRPTMYAGSKIPNNLSHYDLIEYVITCLLHGSDTAARGN